MTIAHREPLGERAWIALQNPAVELANAIADTEFVPQALRGRPAAITAAILYGDEVGLGPMQSLAKVVVINGTPSLYAEAQRALILRDGHDLWIEESTVTRCTIAGRRRGSDAVSRVTWTIDDAKKAGLNGKQPWRMYPRQMLLARASAELARAIFADVIGGLRATEELDDTLEVDAPATNGPATPVAEPTRRRRRTAVTAGAVTTPPAPQPPQTGLPPLPGEEQPAPAEPDPVQDEPEPTLSPQQRTYLHTLFTERGVRARESRLKYVEEVIGRHAESSNELTAAEAQRVIGALEQWDPNDPDATIFPPEGSEP